LRLLVIRSKAFLTAKGRATLVIKTENDEKERPLRDIDSVLIIGSGIKIDSSLPPVLNMHNIPLAVIAKNSISILINPIITKYCNYRRLQYMLDRGRALDIALQYLKARIDGMINILKYYRIKPPEIPKPPEKDDDADTFEQLIRLWESQSSNILWDRLTGALKKVILDYLKEKYNFRGRRPKHPDPFNKALSVMYAVLYSLATKALLAAGLDPTHGFLHKTRYSTPLTFDYTEMFKPIAIQATIDLINTNGLPQLAEDGELTKESINQAIRTFYQYLTLKHKDIRKTPYQQIYLKAFCLAKYLEGKCRKDRLTVTWNRALYRG
jgi:CRISPR-associated endonuclease Cas1